MLSHSRIWAAIDRLAARYDLTPSGLARRAGLDPTTFNRSKRTASDGRPRWPSTESIAKILDATKSDFEDFVALTNSRRPTTGRRALPPIPVIGFAQAGRGGFFDDGGFPVGHGWDEIAFPGGAAENVFALEVSGDSMLPLYRDGDTIIVSSDTPCRRGDRVVVKTRDGEVMAKILQRKTTRAIDLASLNPDHANRTLAVGDIDWIGRIIWASQ
ncbi:MAG: helix-turn-helix transcriptional regulator [Bauldia sp.]